MPSLLKKHWRMFLHCGLIAMAFGMLAMLWPGISLASRAAIFGAYVVVNGIFAIAYGIAGRGEPQWWVNILVGLAGIIAGTWAMTFPGLTAIGLLSFIAAWWVVTGVLEIIFITRIRERIEHAWAVIASGALSIVAGVVLMGFPVFGVINFFWLIGMLAPIFVAMLGVFAFRIRNLDHDAPATHDRDPAGGLA